MEIIDKIVEELKFLDLNLYERKVWMVLLLRGVSDTGEIAKISKVPRNRVYDTLESLAEKGLVVIQQSRPIRYRAINPEEALENLKRKILEKANREVEKIEEFKNTETFSKLKEIYNKGISIIRQEEITTTLKGRDVIMNKLISVIQNAKENISIFVDEDSLDLVLPLSNTLLKAKKNGVDIKIAASISEKVKDKVEIIKNLFDVKTIDPRTSSLKGAYFLTDDSEVIFSLTKSSLPENQIALWARSEEIAKTVVKPIIDLVFEEK